MTSILERITAKEASSFKETLPITSGYFLEAEGENGVVRIYRDAGDGTPVPIATEADKTALKRSIDEAGNIPNSLSVSVDAYDL